MSTLPTHTPPVPPTTVPPTTVRPTTLRAGPISWAERGLAGGLALACGSVLVVASRLFPDPSGVGTHRQLGLPPCGWMAAGNTPCPTCGMTTAFSAMANAHPLLSLKAQPFGALLALASAVAFWLGLYVLITGSRVGQALAERAGRRTMIFTVSAFLLAWVYKIAQVRGWW